MVEDMQFVALPFFGQSGSNSYRCELFMFNATLRQLVSMQNISTNGVTGASSVRAGSYTFLAVSNAYDSNTQSPVTLSYVMRYNSQTRQFYPWQQLTTRSAQTPEFFTINADVYLAVPMAYDGTYAIDSMIYKLSFETLKFEDFQLIPTIGGHHVKPWISNGYSYLSVVNHDGGFVDIYRFDDVAQQFSNVTSGQRLLLDSAKACDVTTIDGSTYMVVSVWQGLNAVSELYRWDSIASKFFLVQDIPVDASVWAFPSFVKIGGDTYLLLTNKMFKWCNNRFILL
jgi:hypothetical protein